MIMLLTQIIDIICNRSPDPTNLDRAYKHAKLMKSQLSLMENFVEDLLNLKLIKEGVFQLVEEPFKIQEALNFIESMFEPHFQTKGLILEQKAFIRAEMPQIDQEINNSVLHQLPSNE